MESEPQSVVPAPRPARGPIHRGVGICLEFIGLYWLLEPVYSKLGLGKFDASRPHLLFLGAFFAVVMTVLPRWRHNKPPLA